MITVAIIAFVVGFLVHPIVAHYFPKEMLVVDMAVEKLLGK